MLEQEQIIRKVTGIGNGAHIFAPKEWMGEEVFVVRRQKKSIKERILSAIEPYLEHIEGAYLYGSYARKEQTKDSDIDLLLITSKKLKIKRQGYEIISIEKEKVQEAIKIAPVLVYSALSEAVPIINIKLLEELKSKYAPKLSDFKEFLESTKRIILINEQFLEEDKRNEIKEESENIPYSLILRVRGILIINSLLSGKSYSHKDFHNWIKKSSPGIDYNSLYDAYKAVKNNKKAKVKVKDLVLLIEFLKEQVKILESRLYGKKRKTP